MVEGRNPVCVLHTFPVTAVVRVGDLKVSFGSVVAVAGVSFEVRAGAATALLGRNGAGKSTTMRVLAGVVPASSGLAEVAGIDVAAEPLEAKRRIGYCPDVGGLIPRATPWEHLQLSARLRGLRDWEPRARQLLDQFDLGGEAHRVTAGFSHGMGRRMSVALAVFHQPPVLLLDEPFDGVDPTGVDATLEAVADARARGAAVILSTHLRDLAVQACDHAVVLRGGPAVAERRGHRDGRRRGRACLPGAPRLTSASASRAARRPSACCSGCAPAACARPRESPWWSASPCSSRSPSCRSPSRRRSGSPRSWSRRCVGTSRSASWPSS